jgi:hypothetical protein
MVGTRTGRTKEHVYPDALLAKVANLSKAEPYFTAATIISL